MNVRYARLAAGLIAVTTVGLTWGWLRKAWHLTDSSAPTWVVVVVILAAMVGLATWFEKILDPYAPYSAERMSDELDDAISKIEAIEKSGRSLDSDYPILIRFKGELDELRKASEALKTEGWSVVHGESNSSSLALQRHQTLDGETILAMTESALVQERKHGIRYLGFNVISA